MPERERRELFLWEKASAILIIFHLSIVSPRSKGLITNRHLFRNTLTTNKLFSSDRLNWQLMIIQMFAGHNEYDLHRRCAKASEENRGVLPTSVSLRRAYLQGWRKMRIYFFSEFNEEIKCRGNEGIWWCDKLFERVKTSLSVVPFSVCRDFKTLRIDLFAFRRDRPFAQRLSGEKILTRLSQQNLKRMVDC